MDMLSQIEVVPENEVEAFASKLEKALSSINGSRNSGLSIGQVRSIKEWCSTSSLEGKPKIILIEGLENSTASASNALLKILEEPPMDTHFILISAQSGRIPATILSRVRKFNFKPFGEKEKAFVLNSLFINPSEYENLYSFFVKYSGINDELIRNGAESVVNSKAFDLPKLVAELEKTQAWDRFFELLLENLRKKFLSGFCDINKMQNLVNDIESEISKSKSFNQLKRLTFDYVIYRIREVLN